MSAAPENRDQSSVTPSPPADDVAPPATEAARFAASGSRWAGFVERLKARLSDPQEIKIHPALALAVLALLLIPTAAGYIVRGYVSASHRPLETNLLLADGSIDPVTALAWSNGPEDRVFVGTRSGRLLGFNLKGAPLDLAASTQDTKPGAVVAIQTTSVDGLPAAVRLATVPAMGGLPPGPLGQSLPFGPETCKSGYVWRQGGEADLVCVTPESRARALDDNAKVTALPTAAGARTDCGSSLVLRAAFDGDIVCVDPATHAETLQENSLDQSRKVLPDAAREGAPDRSLRGIRAERGIIAMAGNMVVVGRAPDQVSQQPPQQQQDQVPQQLQQQAPVAIAAAALPTTPAGGLSQWTLADAAPTEVGQVFGIDDARIAETLPASSTVVAGDGSGAVFVIDASQQVSGVNPDQYLQQLGSHDSAVTAIAAAAAPADANPSFATAAEDGSIKVWWARGVQPAATNVRSADVAPAGRRWGAIASITGERWASLDAISPDGTQLLARSRSNRLSLLSIPNRTSEPSATAQPPTIDLRLGLTGPAAFSRDGRSFAVYAASARAVDIIATAHTEGSITRLTDFATPLRSIQFDPTGGRVALLSDDGSVSMFAVPSATALPRPRLGSGLAGSIAFSPDGTLIAVGLQDGSVAVHRVVDGAPIATIATNDQSAATKEVGFTPSGRQLLLFDTSSGLLSRYSIRNQRLDDAFQIGIEGSAFGILSADTSRLIVRPSADLLNVVDVEHGTTLFSTSEPSMRTVRVSRDASRIAILSAAGDITVLGEQVDDTKTGPMPPLAMDGLRLSADGSTLLLREPDGQLHIADLTKIQDGRARLDPAITEANAMRAELSPNGASVIVGEADGTIDLVDLASGEETPIIGHGDVIQAMAISSDGAYVASASLDGRLRITNLARARRIAALPLAWLSSDRVHGRMSPRYLDHVVLPAQISAPASTLPASIAPTAADTPAANAAAPANDQILAEIQARLNDLGYGPLTVDGIQGQASQAAIQRWQIDNGLKPSGEISPDLLRQMNQSAPPANRKSKS